jgi:hypothetical protein
VLEMDGPRVRRIRIERAAEDRPAA